MKREDVVAALRVEDVINHYGIKIRWGGRWGRARRCVRTDHSSDAFAIARDGMWHCWSCDEGGDLLRLIAIGEQIDVRDDFSRVLEVAGAMAGLTAEDDFGGPVKPTPRPRPEAPPVEPIDKRLAAARKRAKWVWQRLRDRASHAAISRGGRLLADSYLEGVRRIPVDAIRGREDYRDTPLIIESSLDTSRLPDLQKLARMFSQPGIAVPVRSPIDGELVDIRVRRFDPKGDQPKIVGMLGGVTSHERELLGCYGFPHEPEHDSAVVVEGLVDYLTALAMFPDHDVLGAVDAGSLPLVAGIAARAVAARGESGRILLVEHADGLTKAGQPGAGDRSMNEEPNAALKIAIRTLGPRRVGWLFCGGGEGIKDLNDMWRAGVPYAPKWWSEVSDDIEAAASA